MKRSFLIALVSCLIVFGVLEIAAGFWINKYGNSLDKTRKILEVDSQSGWRQKANLNSKFLNLPIITNEWGWRTHSVREFSSQGKKILILGPSSTFGWGINAEDTYSAQLEALLGDLGSVLVINAGEVGYSSEQGLRLNSLPEVVDIKPDIVVIAYGVNDLDKYRFYFQSTKSDSEEFAKTRPAVVYKVLNFVYSSSLLNVLLKSSNFVHSDVGKNSNPLRVPPEKFKENLEKIVEDSRSRGTSLVLLTTTANFEKNNISLSKAEKQEIERIIQGIDVYNAIVLKVGSEKNVQVLNLDELMQGRERGELFVDPIHFSKSGNSLIAAGLRDIILKTSLLRLNED